MTERHIPAGATPMPTDLVPWFECENNRDDGTGLMDSVVVNRDGEEKTTTNFQVIQEAFRECVPPRRVWVGAAWSERAVAENNSLRTRQQAGEITELEQHQNFVVGVYMRRGHPDSVAVKPEI